MPRSLWITPSWLTRIFDKDRKDRGQNKALLNNAATIWRPTLPNDEPRMVDSQVAGMADRNDRYSVQRRVGFKTTEVQARSRELSESLEQQTATAEILRVISSSLTDAQPVFDAIVVGALKL